MESADAVIDDPSTPTQAVMTDSIRERVIDTIREQIMSQRLAPGERLIERELCELTGASRASVREALRQLESDGLVTGVPQRGVVVARLSLDDALSIYEVRSALEGVVASSFVRLATLDERERLFAASEKLKGVTESRAILQAKADFYHILFEGARNPVAEQFLKSLQARVNLMRITSLSAPGRIADSVEEIAQIVRAIRARDPEAAAAAAQFHVRQAARALERTLFERAAPESDHAPLTTAEARDVR
ncbi:GntR family transcriptional regulator [Microbacterium sp. BR1]|uniref:GntR family transcriptional regulator n=1 Tax=Microbacterium sp. BR1 TaxID=1070896 RepID=UPI000C2BCECF|nr:GntR family transcriptional regulator [Microbacterium sp. BR1]